MNFFLKFVMLFSLMILFNIESNAQEQPERPFAWYLDVQLCPGITETVQCCCESGAFTCEVPTYRVVCIPGGSFNCLSEFNECQAIFIQNPEGSSIFEGCEESSCCPENRLCA